jgi:hypothetical protein
VNFYGKTDGPEYQLFGRVAPICETLLLAFSRATGKTPQPSSLSNAMPEWCHSIADRLVLTVLKRLAGLSPGGKFDARNFGRIVGVLLRGFIHFTKEVPAQLKREGLLNLDPENEKKVEAMFDMPAILAFFNEKSGKSISNEDELVEAGSAELEKRAKAQAEALFSVVCYLLARPVAEQHEFLCGIPEGFVLMLDNDGGFSGQRPRTDLYSRLLMYWPEIAEMQKAEPPKTCKFLLDWLEQQEGKQLVEDEKQFYGLCGEIGLVMAPPGHPRKSPVA